MLTKTRPRAVTTSSSEAWSLGQSVKLTSRWAIKKQAVIVEVPTSMPILPMCRIGIYDGTSTITAYFQCGPAAPPQSHTCTGADTDPLPPGQTCQRTPALGTHGWGSPAMSTQCRCSLTSLAWGKGMGGGAQGHEALHVLEDVVCGRSPTHAAGALQGRRFCTRHSDWQVRNATPQPHCHCQAPGTPGTPRTTAPLSHRQQLD